MQEYPAWWPNDFMTSGQPAAKDNKPQRQPPRLAYSLQGKQNEQDVPWQNDLVTVQYLDVPSSGYAQATPCSTREPQGSAGPANQGCAMHHDANKENRRGTHAGIVHTWLAACQEHTGRTWQSVCAAEWLVWHMHNVRTQLQYAAQAVRQSS